MHWRSERSGTILHRLENGWCASAFNNPYHISDVGNIKVIFFFCPRYVRSTPQPIFPAPTHNHNTSLASLCSRSQPSQLKNYVILRYAPQKEQILIHISTRANHAQSTSLNQCVQHIQLKKSSQIPELLYPPLLYASLSPHPAYAPLAHFPFKTETSLSP